MKSPTIADRLRFVSVTKVSKERHRFGVPRPAKRKTADGVPVLSAKEYQKIMLMKESRGITEAEAMEILGIST